MMSAPGWLPVLCILFMLFISSHADACNYTATIEQLDYLTGSDMHFRCSYNTTTATEATVVRWASLRTPNGSVTYSYHIIYSGLLGNRSSFPETGYETRLDELREDFAHVLIIKDISKEENFNILRCTVLTAECRYGAVFHYAPFFIDPQFAAMSMLIDGEVRTAEYETDGPVSVICSAQSAPKAEVSIEGVGTSQTCERLAGEPPTLWNCSVSATLPKGERNVSCRVAWNGVVRSSTSNTVWIKDLPPVTTPSASGAPTGAATGGATTSSGTEIIDGLQAKAQTAASSSVIIGAVVAVVAVLIIAAVVGIFVRKKMKKPSSAEDKGSLT